MSKLPRYTAREMIQIISKQGFVQVRQSGSHAIFKDSSGLRATIPIHGNKTLHPKIIKRILEDAKISFKL